MGTRVAWSTCRIGKQVGMPSAFSFLLLASLGEVGVTARSVPVLEELGCEGDGHVVVFSNALQNIARHMELITHGNADTRSNLVLPLAWHDLGVGARDLDASVEASTVVGISNDTTEAVVSANGAVVRSLGSGISVVRPSKGPGGELSLCTDESVLLLDSEPGLLLGTGIEDLLGVVAEVSVGGLEFRAGSILPSESLGHDEDVVTLAEGVSEDSAWLHDDLRVDGGLKSAALGAESDARAVNPDVLSDGLVGDL